MLTYIGLHSNARRLRSSLGVGIMIALCVSRCAITSLIQLYSIPVNIKCVRVRGAVARTACWFAAGPCAAPDGRQPDGSGRVPVRRR